MADSFYSKWTRLFDAGNTTAWDDILLQYYIINKHARTPESGLLVHGWADTDNLTEAPWAIPETGRAPHVWGRADGWYFMSLIEVLQTFPADHEGYRTLLGYYTSLAEALQRAQDPASGGWWQVMDEPYPGQEGNYIEASGSAMFTFGLMKGIDLGYLNKVDYFDTARTAYLGLVKNFIEEGDSALSYTGTVAECGLGSANATYEVCNEFHARITSRP